MPLPLNFAGDGTLNNRFFATDGSDNALGNPTASHTLVVTAAANNAPKLSWTGEANYALESNRRGKRNVAAHLMFLKDLFPEQKERTIHVLRNRIFLFALDKLGKILDKACKFP